MTLTQLLQRFKWTVLEHQPYSPYLAPSVNYSNQAVKEYLFGQHNSADLAPSDFHIRSAVKNCLSGHKFASDDDVKTFVT